MAKVVLFVFFVILFFCCCFERCESVQDSDYYTAAALQHSKVPTPLNQSATLTMLDNLASMEVFIQDAVSQGAQIVVTPELGLGSSDVVRALNAEYGEDIPEAADMVNPCMSNTSYCATRPALCRASCIARQYSIYFVVGQVDKKPCFQNCHEDGLYLYNCATVFDPTGLVVARYHKEHITTPFPVFDVPPVAEVVYFDTLFGVRFGVFVCLDMLYADPPLSLLAMNISHFVFPTSWINIPPILTATQYQQAWSRGFGVALIAANNGADMSTSGSGIYQQGVPLASYFNASQSKESDQRLLVANLSKVLAPHESLPYGSKSNLQTARRPEGDQAPVDDVQSASPVTECGFIGFGKCSCALFTPLPGESHTLTASFEDLTCSLSYRVALDSPMTAERHALVVFSGNASFIKELDIQLCTLVRCATPEACVVPDPWDPRVYEAAVLFESLVLSGNFTVSSNEKLFNLIATNQSQLLDPANFDFDGSSTLATSGSYRPMAFSNFGLLARVWNATSDSFP